MHNIKRKIICKVLIIPKPIRNAVYHIPFWHLYGVLSLNVINVFCSSKAEKLVFVHGNLMP